MIRGDGVSNKGHGAGDRIEVGDATYWVPRDADEVWVHHNVDEADWAAVFRKLRELDERRSHGR